MEILKNILSILACICIGVPLCLIVVGFWYGVYKAISKHRNKNEEEQDENWTIVSF